MTPTPLLSILPLLAVACRCLPLLAVACYLSPLFTHVLSMSLRSEAPRRPLLADTRFLALSNPLAKSKRFYVGLGKI